jgi:hypothetical protein
VGGIFEYGPEGSGYVNLSLGNTSYWAVPPEDWDGRLPTVPGTSMSWDLHAFDGQGDAVGSIVFTATTSIGGTWSAIGIPMTGTWGN